MFPIKLAIIATHPIQYHIPWFRLLSENESLDLTVYYAFIPGTEQQGVGFGMPFSWDIPMLKGYKWKALPNAKKNPGLKGFFNSSTPAINREFTENKPDVVIITGWQSLPLLQALWAALRLRIPRIIRGESNALRKRKWWVRLLHSQLLSHFNVFLAIGKANREFYLQYGIAPENIFPCNYFVDNNRFQKQYNQIYVQRDVIRAEWGISSGHTCFLYAGKLIPKKRIMDLLQAFEKAFKLKSDIHLLVAGTGELMEDAQQFASKYRIPVTFAGFLNQTEITKAYVAADCLVLPSDFGETWGLVVNEAMACGLPAIVSDMVGCCPDLVKNGVTGFVYPFGDINALVDRMLEMASSDKDKCIQMGKNAQKLVLEDYSVEKAVEGTVKAIQFVISSKNR